MKNRNSVTDKALPNPRRPRALSGELQKQILFCHFANGDFEDIDRKNRGSERATAMTSTKPDSEYPQAEDGDYRKVILRAFACTPLLRTAAGLCREIETRFGQQAVIVGGAVRDILKGQPVADADIAMAVSAKEISAVFEDSFGIGQS